MKATQHLGDDGATADTGRGFFGGQSFAAPRVKLLRVEDVRQSPHNPKRRIDLKRLRPLVKSMAAVGLLYEILVDSNNVIIDGHRRLAAAKELGWETIPAKIIPDGQDADSLYASVNVTPARMTGNDALNVWLANPKAVSPQQAKSFAEMRNALGKRMVDEIAEAGQTVHVFRRAKQVSIYIGETSDADLRRVARWLLDVATINDVVCAMREGVSKARLASAVRDSRPLRFASQSD